MMKALLLATLLISTCYAYCPNKFYYGVEDDQPIATGLSSFFYGDDIGEIYSNEEFYSNVTQFSDGTYVSKGFYQQNVHVLVYNKYFVGCQYYEYDNEVVQSYNFTTEGFRSPSDFGKKFTSQQVSPSSYNATLKETIQEFTKTYSQQPQAFAYVKKALEYLTQKIQVNNIQQN